MTPFDPMIQQDAAAELTPADLGSLREAAKPIAIDGPPARLRSPSSISYFSYEPPSRLARVRVSVKSDRLVDLFIEVEKGNRIAEEKNSWDSTIEHFASSF